ncbi:extracellular solute-binding protein [Eubacteriales bacterium OttesenSCG-928-A19]|nr:extracellular solute-binding protein [Eubacteriales bacterium OttesenSCG-928-A19]
MKMRSLSLLLAAIMLLASLPAIAFAGETPEYVEITVEVFDRGTDDGKTDPTNNYWTDWIKAKVLEDENIGVTFVAVSRWEETEQLNNLMASGTAPDICFTYSNELIANYRDLGGLTDLSPYIDSHLADLKSFLGADAAIEGRDLIQRNMDPDTGAIFSIPARRMNPAGGNTFMRKDWLDALGLPLPTTLEEFHDALKAFKEQDPGGVGTENVIPFTMTTDVRWRAANLIDSFVDPEITTEERYVNTVVDRNFLLPGVKEGYRYLNQLFHEGLIDPEFFLYEDDITADNLIKSGVVGAFGHNWDQAYRDSPGLLRDLLVNVPDAEIVTVDPFLNSAGEYFKYMYDAAGLNFFVPAASEANLDAALRYLNWLARFDNYNYLQFGEEGVNHEIVDGAPKLIDARGETIQNSLQNIDYTIPMNGIYLGDDETTAKALANSYSVDAEYITVALEMSLNGGSAMPVIPVTLSAAGPYAETLRVKGITLMCESITAAPDQFDKVWDDGIADWLASGAQEIIDERAEKYIEP